MLLAKWWKQNKQPKWKLQLYVHWKSKLLIRSFKVRQFTLSISWVLITAKPYKNACRVKKRDQTIMYWILLTFAFIFSVVLCTILEKQELLYKVLCMLNSKCMLDDKFYDESLWLNHCNSTFLSLKKNMQL